MRVGIVGYGKVGSSLEKLFSASEHKISVYDKFKKDKNGLTHQDEVQSADLVFLAVPTPSLADGHCDLSAVLEAVSWISRPLCIKSTIPPGTTDRLVRETNKAIVFSPEYVGETPFHPYREKPCDDLVVVGGLQPVAEQFISLYQSVLGPIPRYFVTSAVTAELAKYMENCFFATKVSFVAQFYELAEIFGADFHEMREIWLSDSRIGRSHSAIIDQPGFSGRCLPKDLAAIISAAHDRNFRASLLEAVRLYNDSLRRQKDR